MFLKVLSLVHICSASAGLLSGYLAMVLRKGSGLHGAAGSVFFVSMVSASAAGAYLAGFAHPNSGNVIGSTLTLYLVSTAWVAARRKDGKPGLFDLGALLFVLSIIALAATWGFQASVSPTGSKDGYPLPFYIVFGSIALLFAVSDIRMLVHGGVFGAKRIARHLWRMCVTLLFATLSFYPGQATKLFPKWFRDTRIAYVPAVLLLGAMLLWLVRVSLHKRVPQSRLVNVSQGHTTISSVTGSTEPAHV